MTLELKPQIAAALQALASAKGLSLEEYLQYLVEREFPDKAEDASNSDASGMVWEDGLLVYRTGRPLPLAVVDDSVRQARLERAKHILGNSS